MIKTSHIKPPKVSFTVAILLEVVYRGISPSKEGWTAQDEDEVPLSAPVIFFFPSVWPLLLSLRTSLALIFSKPLLPQKSPTEGSFVFYLSLDCM